MAVRFGGGCCVYCSFLQLFESGLLVDGGRYVEYFFQQLNRVRVQGVRGGEGEGVEEGQVQGDVGR